MRIQKIFSGDSTQDNRKMKLHFRLILQAFLCRDLESHFLEFLMPLNIFNTQFSPFLKIALVKSFSISSLPIICWRKTFPLFCKSYLGNSQLWLSISILYFLVLRQHIMGRLCLSASLFSFCQKGFCCLWRKQFPLSSNLSKKIIACN